jgi:nicotinamidase-related amidase
VNIWFPSHDRQASTLFVLRVQRFQDRNTGVTCSDNHCTKSPCRLIGQHEHHDRDRVALLLESDPAARSKPITVISPRFAIRYTAKQSRNGRLGTAVQRRCATLRSQCTVAHSTLILNYEAWTCSSQTYTTVISLLSNLQFLQHLSDTYSTHSMASESLVFTTQDLSHDVTVGTIKCQAAIPFGGEEQWLYQPATKKFDLSRGSEQKMVFECDEADRNHSGFMIDPATAILIVVDMQNYFINPIYRDHAAGIAAVEPTIKAIERCRKEGIQIAWLNWGITDESLKSMAPAIQRGFCKTLGWHVGLGAQLPDRQGRCLFKRSWNADLYEPMKAVAQPGDLFFDKARMSGLWSTEEPLHEFLRASGKQTLLFAGVNTDQCVFGTVSDAYSYGWDCILLSDCTGTMTGRGAQELAEYQISTNMGFVTNSSALCDAKIL